MGQCGSAMGGADVQSPPLTKQQQQQQAARKASTRRSSKQQQVAHSSPGKEQQPPQQRERSRNSCNWAIGGATNNSHDGGSFFSGAGLNHSNLSGPGTAPSSNTSAISISAIGSPHNIASFTSRPPPSSNGQHTQQQQQQQQQPPAQPQPVSHHHRVKSESQQLPLVMAAGLGNGGGGSFVHVNPRPTYSTTHSRVSSTGVGHYAPVSSSKILLASPTSQGHCFQGVVDPPMDCTEVEHYYDDDCAEYLDYVRRWEAEKDAEARATADPVRGERSLFFGLAKLHQQQWEAAVVACHNQQQSSKLLHSAESLESSLGKRTGPAAQFTLELPGSNACSPRDATSTILTPRCPASTDVPVAVVAPTVPHIAQSSMLAFMAELIAESNALATAAASRVSSPIPVTRTLAVATSHGLVSYNSSSVQGSPTARLGVHKRTFSGARHQQQPSSAGGPQGSPHSGCIMSLSPPASDCITTTRKPRSNSMQHAQPVFVPITACS